MKTDKAKFRDYLAMPFLVGSAILERLAIDIGGSWTADIILDSYRKMCKKL